MIYYFKPYSTEGRLFSAYDRYAMLIDNPDDYICFLDGDTLFLNKNWGHIIEAYTKKYPDAGLITCYASRCSYRELIPRQGDPLNTDLKFHIEVSRILQKKHSKNLTIKHSKSKIAGYLMLMKKSTWLQIRDLVRIEVNERGKKILGVDTAISRAVLKIKKDIIVMRAVYILHLFRLDNRGYKRGQN